ncbi:MAG: hypothetical protein H0U52_06800 [Chloroflexi bacterium]|nr:hypothetical protein [Chloroflexota bacterium]
MHVDIVVPRTQIPAKMRLLSRREEFEAKSEARTAMLDAGYPLGGESREFGTAEQWLVEVAVRMVAVAVREPTNPERALASIDDWRDCDDNQILALWSEYCDLAARLDPVGSNKLTDQELDGIIASAKKKDVDLLMAFGSRRLALFAITSASPPASSETPTS